MKGVVGKGGPSIWGGDRERKGTIKFGYLASRISRGGGHQQKGLRKKPHLREKGKKESRPREKAWN